MRRWLGICVAMLALVVAFGAPAARWSLAEEACVLCAGTKAVACPTCAGKGIAQNPCEACGGDGTGRCDDRPKSLGRLPADWAEFFRVHKGTSRACPNVGCKKGRVELAKSSCKVCGGAGSMKCLVCSAPCAVCGGKKVREGPCVDCDGTGKLPCLLCAPASGPCATCGGKPKVPCAACKGAGHVLDFCASCAGRGRNVCPLCSGASGRAACLGCFGSGKDVMSTIGSSAAPSKCRMCDGKGCTPCPSCDQGWAKCGKCDGAKRVDDVCARCAGSKVAPCRACGTAASRTLEVEALQLSKTPRRDAAVPLMERAVQVTTKAAAAADVTTEQTDDDLTEKINAIDLGEFGKSNDKAIDTLRAARVAIKTHCAAAAVSDELHRTVARLQKELAEIKRPAAAPPVPK